MILAFIVLNSIITYMTTLAHSIEKLSSHEEILVPKEKRVLDLHVTGIGGHLSQQEARLVPNKIIIKLLRCCYITVDSAMAASQNGFCSIHKKTNIMQIMKKNNTIFIYLIFYHREILKLDNFLTLSLSYANTVL